MGGCESLPGDCRALSSGYLRIIGLFRLWWDGGVVERAVLGSWKFANGRGVGVWAVNGCGETGCSSWLCRLHGGVRKGNAGVLLLVKGVRGWVVVQLCYMSSKQPRAPGKVIAGTGGKDVRP